MPHKHKFVGKVRTWLGTNEIVALLRSIDERLTQSAGEIQALSDRLQHHDDQLARFAELAVALQALDRRLDELSTQLSEFSAQRNETTGSAQATGSITADAPSVPDSIAAHFDRLYERILDTRLDDTALGFRRDQVPCLIELNQDLLWVPADLLKYLWHTRIVDPGSVIPRFLAETPHYNWIREHLRPGDVVLDCGANLGLFTTMMASCVDRVGQVHAFEPSPSSCADLRRVLHLNDLHWVVVKQVAIADSEGQALFYDVLEADVRRESSHLSSLGTSSWFQGLHQNQVLVPTTTLDRYIAQAKIAPQLIKIDVEGAEFLALEGARQCMATHKPLLVIEIHWNEPGNFDHERLRSYLTQYHYRYALEDKIYYCE